jgi:hypothetical protein
VKFGMTEKTFCIYNPLPAVTEEELFEAAGMNEGMVRIAERSPFMLEWRYSGGREREYIDLKPGESKQIRKVGAEMFVKANADQGAIMFAPGTPRDEVLRLSIAAVQKAIKFWHDRGAPRIAEYRKVHGLSKEELEDQKYDIWPYYLNAARAKALEAHLKDLRKELAEVTAAKTKRNAAAA